MAGPFYYGGQAVIEGVLIRGRQSVCLAVRCTDGGIWTGQLPLSKVYSGPLRAIPLIRGVIILVETLLLGVRALNRSAEIAMTPPEARPSESGEPPRASKKERTAMAASMLLALVLGVGIFFLLPLLGARTLDSFISSALVSNLVEGAVRLTLLVGYIWGVGHLPDMRRVFAYHGAEHMTIHAHEHSLPLDTEHIQRFSTAHPRCGTAFLLTVVLVSIVVFALLGHPPLWLAVISRLALVPVIGGISYEIIRFSGAHSQNPLARLLMLPGLALQRLTTRQPDESQIEVAVAAMTRALAADAEAAAPDPNRG